MIESDEVSKIIQDNYELITENISELIFIINKRYQIEYNNRFPVMRFLGYDSDKLIGNSWLNYVYNEDLDFTIKSLEDCNRGKTINQKLRLVHKNGNTKQFQATFILIKGYIEQENILLILKDIPELPEDKIFNNSEEKFEIITEAVPVGISITTPKGKIIECNSEVIKMFGYNTKEELMKIPVIDYYYDPKDRDEFLEIHKSGFVKDFEVQFKRKDGTIFWGLLTSIEQKLGNKRVFINSFQDITVRKKAEINIHQSESELAAIYDYIPLAIIVVDNERRIRKINKFALNLTGHKEEEVIGLYGGQALRCLNSIKNPLGCGHSQDCHECIIRNTIIDTLETKSPHINIEANLNLLPGSKLEEIYFLFSSIPIMIDGKDFALVSFIDVTEHKLAEKALHESEARLRAAIESLPFDVFIINEDGYYVMQNNVCRRHWGDIVGKRPRDVVSNTNTLAIWESNNSRAFSGETVAGEVKFEVNGELRYQYNIITPIYIDNQIKNIIGVNIDITDRVKAEAELDKVSERLKYLATSGPAVIYSAKVFGDYGATFISDNVKDITGYKPEEFTNNTEFWINNIHPDDRSIILSKLSKLKGNKSLGYEYRFKFKDGIYHWIRNESKIISDKKGNPLEMVGSWSDITWSKKSEEKLQYQAQLVENVTDAIISTDLNFRVITWNNAAEEIYGWKAEEILGKKVMKTIPLEYPYDEPKAVVKQVFEQGSWKGEVNQPRKDGTLINILASVSLVKDITGKPIGVVAINHDISDRKVAEKKLKESEEKFRNIAEQSSLGLIIQQDRLIKFANAAVADITEYPLEKIKNWSFKDLQRIVHKEDLPFLISKLELLERQDDQISEQFECKFITKSGRLKWVEIIAKPIIYMKKLAVFASLVDITAKKKLEEDLKEISKLKTELLSRTSHELKTPLVSIKGYADLLLTQHYEELDFYTISILHEIKQGCSRLESLIRDLLETSKLESGEIELIKTEEDLAFLIRFCVRDLKGLVEIRKHELVLNIENEMITLFEKERIYEVIINLISNAIKYTPKNGKILIKSKTVGKNYIISVQDTGIGLTEEEKGKIFKKFGKVERYGQGLDVVSEGSGLGLYISKKIIELHGGNMWVESEGRKKGSTFYFSLPIKKN